MPSLTDTSSAPAIARNPRSHTPTSYTSTQASRSQRPPSQPIIPVSSRKSYLQQRELSASPTIPPARPSTPAGSSAALRLTMPTLSSRLKQRTPSNGPPASDHTGRNSTIMLGTGRPSLSPTNSVSSITSLAFSPSNPSTILKRPRRSRTYGDGSELDAFDDLPTNKEKERRYTASVVPPTKTSSFGGLSAIPGSPSVDPSKRYTGGTLGKRKKIEKRVMPQLIRNLNASANERGVFSFHMGHHRF